MTKRKGIDFSKGVRGLHFGRKLKFQFASTDLIAQLEHVAREFFHEVLDISFDECLVTDESLIDDFLNEESPNDFEQRFREKYGFDLSDVGSDVIVRILSKIAAMQDQPPPS